MATAFRLLQATKPARIVTLSPKHWAGSFKGAPRCDILVGINRLSASNVDTANEQAAKAALDSADTEAALARFNNKIMAWAVAYAHCDPNDAGSPCEDLGMRGDDEIEERLTPEGIRLVFEAVNDLHNESPLYPPASDAELATLREILSSPKRPIDVVSRRLAGRLLRALCVDEDE